MLRSTRMHLALAVAAIAVTALTGAAQAQAPNQSLVAKPTNLPNPYRLVEGWPSLPQSSERRPPGARSSASGWRATATIWVFNR